MKVSELRHWLAQLPPDEDVSLLYDGFCLIPIGAAWLSQETGVIVSGLKEPIYHNESRIAGAVSETVDGYLSVAEMLGLAEPEFYADPKTRTSSDQA